MNSEAKGRSAAQMTDDQTVPAFPGKRSPRLSGIERFSPQTAKEGKGEVARTPDFQLGSRRRYHTLEPVQGFSVADEFVESRAQRMRRSIGRLANGRFRENSLMETEDISSWFVLVCRFPLAVED
jgi:hypothetical protein